MMAAKDSAHAAAYEEDRSLRNADGESEDEVDFEDRVTQLKNSGEFEKVRQALSYYEDSNSSSRSS